MKEELENLLPLTIRDPEYAQKYSDSGGISLSPHELATINDKRLFEIVVVGPTITPNHQKNRIIKFRYSHGRKQILSLEKIEDSGSRTTREEQVLYEDGYKEYRIDQFNNDFLS